MCSKCTFANKRHLCLLGSRWLIDNDFSDTLSWSYSGIQVLFQLQPIQGSLWWFISGIVCEGLQHEPLSTSATVPQLQFPQKNLRNQDRLTRARHWLIQKGLSNAHLSCLKTPVFSMSKLGSCTWISSSLMSSKFLWTAKVTSFPTHLFTTWGFPKTVVPTNHGFSY